MLRFVLVALLYVIPSLLQGQAVHEQATLHGDSPQTRSEKASFCISTDLFYSDEGRQHLREFLEWDDSGRPGIRLYSVYNVGDKRSFRARNVRTNTFYSTDFTLRAKGERSYIWVEDDEFGPGKVTMEIVEKILESLEERTFAQSINPQAGIVEINVETFGQPPDVDGSGMLHVLLLDVRDNWDPDGNTGYVAGFFDPVNLNPNNSNSNGKDIIYIDTMPHIYREGVDPVARRAKSTLAHEHQHLIHARYGNLNTFQNEGQSEWSEILTGFDGRGINYVFSPSQLNQQIYTWRRDTPDVLIDYQRASLFHSYLAERFGAQRTGAITRASLTGNNAYSTLFLGTDTSLGDVILDFHVANVINNTTLADGRFGYEDSRRANVLAMGRIHTFPGGLGEVRTTRSLHYGGVEYIEFAGVENFAIAFSSETGVSHALVGIPLEGSPEIVLDSRMATMSDRYERIVLISTFSGSSQATEETRTYSFEASWDPVPILQDVLSYHAQIQFFTSLPGDPSNNNTAGLTRLAQRISPKIDGRVTSVSFVLNNRPTSIVGDGNLNIRFKRAIQGQTIMVPSNNELGVLSVPFAQLSRGNNFFALSDTWPVESGTEYFIEYEVEDFSGNASLEFLLDAGSEDENNPNYFPIRTIVYLEEPTSNPPRWTFFTSRSNLAMSVGVGGLFTGDIDPPTVELLTTRSAYPLGADVTLEASASGTPVPSFQWFRDGQPIPGATSATFAISPVTRLSEGTYSVAAINPGGMAMSEELEIRILEGDFTLAQNYPNPFNPQTTIRYILTEEAPVLLQVFSSDGRLVKTLVDEVQQPDLYIQTFDASELASGVYIYRLQAGNRRLVRTMTYLR